MFRLLRYGLFLVILSGCTATLRVSDTKTSHYELKAAKSDSIADLGVSPYKRKLDLEMKQVIAYSDSALTRDGSEPSVGNFMGMAVQEFINRDRKVYSGNSLIILNRGGLRNNLPKGEITRGHIFELMPFDNEIVILKLSGARLQECIQAMLNEKKLFSLNLQMNVSGKAPDNIIVYDTPFDVNETYYVVTSDYLAMGGDNCSFFAKPLAYETTGMKIRDAIMMYCEALTKNNTAIKPMRFGKIKVSK